MNLIRIGANDVTNSGFGYFGVAVDLLGIPGIYKDCSWIGFLSCKFDLKRK